MPTHQQKTQTDILIGSGGPVGGGTSQAMSELEIISTYSGGADFEFADLAPGTDRLSAGYELIVRDRVGTPIAILAARYKAWVDRGSAVGPKAIDIVNTFVPAPSGSNPAWPLSGVTTAERQWSVDVFDPTGGLFAQQWATWQVRTTIGSSSGSVIQTVTDQTDQLLRLNLVYMDGVNVLLDVVVTMTADSIVQGPVTADPPDVTDRFTP